MGLFPFSWVSRSGGLGGPSTTCAFRDGGRFVRVCGIGEGSAGGKVETDDGGADSVGKTDWEYEWLVVAQVVSLGGCAGILLDRALVRWVY